ncbi:hypothetical protein GCM10008943_03050 [Paenochrobactrum glaciei]|uniref:Surface antigen n=2 Tax=Paenochrobactrum glaciei TaxID=486407 RepID=A0ABN1FIP2_9HYPH
MKTAMSFFGPFSGKFFSVIMLVGASAVLSACGTAGKAVPDLRLPSTGFQKNDTGVLSELGNGLLGSNALQLAGEDRRKALEAEYRALEYSAAGKAVSWKAAGASASGEVVAAQPYQVGSQNCRQYTHSFNMNGVPQTVRGTACRNPNGSWTPLT